MRLASSIDIDPGCHEPFESAVDRKIEKNAQVFFAPADVGK